MKKKQPAFTGHKNAACSAGLLPYKKFWSNHRGETHKLLVLHLPPVKARVKEGTLLPKTECFHAKTI